MLFKNLHFKNYNKVFWTRAFTHLIPLCPSPKTEKQNRFFLFKKDLLSQIKGKHVHHITLRMRLRFAPQTFAHIARVYAFGVLYTRTTSHTQKRYVPL